MLYQNVNKKTYCIISLKKKTDLNFAYPLPIQLLTSNYVPLETKQLLFDTFSSKNKRVI